MGRGPPSVLGVSGNYPRFTFRGPRASALAPVHAATVLVFNGRILAGSALTCFGKAALAGPVGAKLGVNFCEIWLGWHHAHYFCEGLS